MALRLLSGAPLAGHALCPLLDIRQQRRRMVSPQWVHETAPKQSDPLARDNSRNLQPSRAVPPSARHLAHNRPARRGNNSILRLLPIHQLTVAYRKNNDHPPDSRPRLEEIPQQRSNVTTGARLP